MSAFFFLFLFFITRVALYLHIIEEVSQLNNRGVFFNRLPVRVIILAFFLQRSLEDLIILLAYSVSFLRSFLTFCCCPFSFFNLSLFAFDLWFALRKVTNQFASRVVVKLQIWNLRLQLCNYVIVLKTTNSKLIFLKIPNLPYKVRLSTSTLGHLRYPSRTARSLFLSKRRPCRQPCWP